MKEQILFDADNTLFDFTKSSKVAFTKTLEILEINRKEDLKPTFNYVNDICWKAFENNKMTGVELRTKRFEMFFEAVGEWRNPKEASDLYLKGLSEADFLIEGAIELLEKLKSSGKKLTMITNGLTEVQRPKFRASGLTPYFDVIVVSDEIGHAKPHKEFFDYTFQRLNFPKKESTIVVGDSLNSDIKGGKNYGLSTCWFNPSKKENKSQIQPDFEIHELAGLVEILS